MKAILVKDVLTLPEMAKRKDFPEESGLYLVDDGKFSALVEITDEMIDDTLPCGYMIPRDSVVKDYEEVSHKTIENIEEAIVALGGNISTLAQPVISPTLVETSGNSVDLGEVTKLVEVVAEAILDNKKS